MIHGENKFSTRYYRDFLTYALEEGYVFYTLGDFIKTEMPQKKCFVIRHDLDKDPVTIEKKIKVEMDLGIRSTNFIRVAGPDYNFLSYPVFNVLKNMQERDFEIGLHTGFLEFAKINSLDPIDVLKKEFQILNSFFKVRGIATHRDINYTYNSLPYLVDNWNKIKLFGPEYQAYDDRIFKSCIYINEGLSPHLGWRSKSPEEIIKTGQSVYLLTHNHWWFDVHPFE